MAHRIGILTLLRHRNPGTYFQALGTYQALREAFADSTIEFIDVMPRSIPTVGRRDLRQMVGSFQYTRFVWSYRKAWTSLPHSRERIITNEPQAAAQFVQDLNYDVVVLGSDVVLKIVGDECARKVPPIFWLPPLRRTLKVMLASSCDNTRLSDIAPQLRLLLSASACSFTSCYVRDDVTRQLLIDLGVDTGRLSLVPDPAFALDVPAGVVAQSRETFTQRVGSIQRPVLGVNLGEEQADWKDDLVGKLKADGYHLVALRQYPGVQYLGRISPWEWAGIFPCFDQVLTYSFHETVFCLKQGVPVVNIAATKRIIELESGWSKGRYLLQQFGLNEACCLDAYGKNQATTQYMREVVLRVRDRFDCEAARDRAAELGHIYRKCVTALKAATQAN